MKIIIITILFAFSLIPINSLNGQCTVNKFCLSFADAVVNAPAGQFEFDIVMSSNADFGLGSSNIQFRYNNLALSNPTIVSTTVAPPEYQTTHITTPFIPSLGEFIASVNIELNNADFGKNIPVAGTVIARIRFTITNPSMSSNLVWYYNGGTTQTIVYDQDESTQLCSVTDDNTCLAPLGTVLPIELLSFNLTPNKKSFDLLWKTQQEVNFKGFALERSAVNTIDFKEIAFEAAKGSTGENSYDYTDTEVQNNITYSYRLKMIDFDGGYTYSNIVSGKLSDSNNSFNVYPNPLSKSDDLNVTTEYIGVTQLSIWDSSSKLLLQRDFNQQTLIDLKNYSSGVYYYKLTSDGISKYGNFSVID